MFVMESQKISLREARQIALQVFIETEKAIQESRIAEARFLDAVLDEEDDVEVKGS